MNSLIEVYICGSFLNLDSICMGNNDKQTDRLFTDKTHLKKYSICTWSREYVNKQQICLSGTKECSCVHNQHMQGGIIGPRFSIGAALWSLGHMDWMMEAILIAGLHTTFIGFEGGWSSQGFQKEPFDLWGYVRNTIGHERLPIAQLHKECFQTSFHYICIGRLRETCSGIIIIIINDINIV